MGLQTAIDELQAEITALELGTPTQPVEGTTEWFKLRSAAIGLSLLRKMKQLDLSERPAAAERFYRESSRRVKRELG